MLSSKLGQLNLQEIPPYGSRTVDCFEKLVPIGQGTFSQVFMAKEIQTGEVVALKKIRMGNEKEGFPASAIREIKTLNKLHHENIIKLKEVVTSDPGLWKDRQETSGFVYMVFEYMDHNLCDLRRAGKLSAEEIKCYMRQLLMGLHYCHVNRVLHRDIKGVIKSSKVLVNHRIWNFADFGLSRSFSNDHNENLTNRVITQWYRSIDLLSYGRTLPELLGSTKYFSQDQLLMLIYCCRPPELLLGSTQYGPAVDMWSVGCVFAELLEGKVLFQGENEAGQLNRIFKLCGAPDEYCWPGITKLPLYDNFKSNRPLRRRFKEHFKNLDQNAFELLERMLVLDPGQRITASQALDSEYFWTDPIPCDPKSLQKYESSYSFLIKQKRREQRQQEDQKFKHPNESSSLLPIQQSGVVRAQNLAGRIQPISPEPIHPGLILLPILLPVLPGPGRPRGRKRPYRGRRGGERGGSGSVLHLQQGQGPDQDGILGVGPQQGGSWSNLYQGGPPFGGSGAGQGSNTNHYPQHGLEE